MTLSRSINFLPEYFQTKINKRFLNSTLDRLISAAEINRFDGYVGEKSVNGKSLDGSYIQESNESRTNYQLEPAYITKNTNGDISSTNNFEDLLNSVANQNGIIDSWNKLLTDNMFNWKGFTNLDKLVNYQNYIWLSQFDSNNDWFWNNSIEVSNGGILLNGNFNIVKNEIGFTVSTLNGPNPSLTLVRGGTYTFNISSGGYQGNVWIQTNSGVSGKSQTNPSLSSRNVPGVINNGISNGSIQFTVPTINNNQVYLNLNTLGGSDDFVDFATTLNFNEINGQQANSFSGIDGISSINNCSLIFAANQTTGWDNSLEGNVVPNNQRFQVWTISIVNNIIQLLPLRNIETNYKITIVNGKLFNQTSWFKNISGGLSEIPLSSNLQSTFFLQDENSATRVIQLNIVSNQNIPTTTPSLSSVSVATTDNIILSGIQTIDGVLVSEGDRVLVWKQSNAAQNGIYIVSNTFWERSIDLEESFQLSNQFTVNCNYGFLYNNSEFFYSSLVQNPIIDVSDVIFTQVIIQPGIDVVNEIIGKENYVSGNNIKFVNGLKIKFTPQTTPQPFNDITKSWIVEGVGKSINLVPVNELIIPRSIQLLNNQPDYITISRENADKNGWSRTNQWFHKDVINFQILTLLSQNVKFDQPSSFTYARRPIIEFISGLVLFQSGLIGLSPANYIDIYTVDAFSNVLGTTNFSVDNNQLNQGDLVIFNADKDSTVRKNVYQVNFVDTNLVTTDNRLSPVVAATTTNILLSGLQNIDGITINSGDRILVWKQNNLAECGIYIASAGSWFRSTDCNSNSVIQSQFGVLTLSGNTYNNKYFIHGVDNNAVLNVDNFDFSLSTDPAPIITLKLINSAVDQNCILIKSGSVFSDTTYVWSDDLQYWNIANQNKTSLQQTPKFDIIDENNNSFSTYEDSTFTGSVLFSYGKGVGVTDSILNIPLLFGNVGNLNDIIFENNFETDTFSYEINSQPSQLNIELGYAQRLDPISLTVSKYDPWEYINCNLELYQNILVNGSTSIRVLGKLLTKVNGVSQTNKVYVDGVQLSSDEFQIQQVSDYIVININENIVGVNSSVLIKLLSTEKIIGSWYDVPPAFSQNPLGEVATSFSLSDLKDHLTTVINNRINYSSNNQIYNLDDNALIGSLGNIVFHESLSILPTLLLCNSNFNIDQAIKSAGDDYILYKQQFLKISEKVPNIENLSSKEAVDSIISLLSEYKNNTMPWFYSDMVPINGTPTHYNIFDPTITSFNLSNTYNFNSANNQAILVYLNNKQLIINQDYKINNKILIILTSLNENDQLDIYEINNTDGCYIPATPTKLGLYNSYIPQIFIDNSYQSPALVIQGHDGSITQAYNDYRDNLLLEFELRIFNNLKVNNQFWTDLIEKRVPTAGYFRENQRIENFDICPYSVTDQTYILQRMFYEWSAANQINYTQSFYDANNPFTWNWSGSLDKFGNTVNGYWKGIYKYYFDSYRADLRPWEILNISIKPTWWDSVYGPAPYTGTNFILWQDLANGIVKDPSGTYISSFGPRIYNNLNALSLIPVNSNGQTVDPSKCVISQINYSSLNLDFSFGDMAPSEIAWRNSSLFPFSLLRSKIIQNPIFMLGTLWNLDNYKPSTVQGPFQFNDTSLASVNEVMLNTVDHDENNNLIRCNSIINFSTEYLRKQGLQDNLIKESIANTNVNLMYKLSGFSNADNLSIYLEQTSESAQGTSVKIPTEDYSLFLNKSIPTNTLVYSGIVISKVSSGYKINGYDKLTPYFTVFPVTNQGPKNTLTVGNTSYSAYLTYNSNIELVPYNTIFSNVQDVINFILGYGYYLTSIGFIFDVNSATQQINWTMAATQFIKWSLENWSLSSSGQSLTLVLNPGVSELKIQNSGGTLDDLSNTYQNIVVDVNQNQIISDLDVFRSDDYTLITRPENKIIAGLRSNIVSFEHRLIINNTTIFNDIVYQPATGLRALRLRIVGQKSANWDGTLDTPGFLLATSKVDNWVADQDYLMGSVVSFKNTNYIATQNIIGSDKFQYNQFVVTSTIFTDSLLPNLSLKVEDLSNAYNSEYRTYITDFVKLRGNTLGYVERSWLSNLGIDTGSQIDFYRGWIKSKGSLNSINNFSRSSNDYLLTNINLNEEFAFKVGEYGATSRTGYGEVAISNNVNTKNPLVIKFVDTIDPTDARSIQVTPYSLYEKSNNWSNDIIQNRGTFKSSKQPFNAAGPVTINDILSIAQSRVPQLNTLDKNALYFNNYDELLKSSLQSNLLKIAINSGLIWIANDSTTNSNDTWNVIKFINANTKITNISQLSNNSISIGISTNINVSINSLIAVNLNETNVTLQGIFKVTDYIISPNNESYATVIIEVNNVSVSSVNFSTPISTSPLYVATSLRFSDIGSANLLIEKNILGLPVETNVFVESDINQQWASYKYVEPYISGPMQVDIAVSGTINTVAYDNINSLLWTSSNGNTIAVNSVTNYVSTDGNTYPVLNSTIGTSVAGREDSLNIGNKLISLQNTYVAATANTIDTNGQLYIYEWNPGDLPDFIQVRQILGGHNNFAENISCSLDGNWIFASNNSSNVSCFTLAATNEVHYDVSALTSNSCILLGQQPDNNYSLRVVASGNLNQILLPTVDYFVNENVLTLTNSGSALTGNLLISDNTLTVEQLPQYYNFVTCLPDSNSSLDISSDDNATRVAVATNNSVNIYQQVIEQFYVTVATSNIVVPQLSTVSNISVLINNSVVSKASYQIDNNLIMFNQTIPADSIVIIKLNQFEKIQTIPSNGNAISLSLSNSALLIGNPDLENNINGITYLRKGKTLLYTFNQANSTEINIPLSELIINNDPFTINNWVMYSGSNYNLLVTNINSISSITGVTASINNSNLTVLINKNYYTSGLLSLNSNLTALTGNFSLIQTLDNSDILQSGFGQKVNWLNNDLFSVISNYGPQYIESELIKFSDRTQFDSNNIKFYDGSKINIQRVTIYQLLSTDSSWINKSSNIIQATPVKVIQIENNNGSQTYLDGKLDNIWIGNRLGGLQNLQVYSNQNLVHGWTINNLSSNYLEPLSISRAWLYDKTQKLKLIDLEVSDLSSGVLPGSILVNLDYISDNDPAIYGVMQWKSTFNYNAGDRFIYNNQTYEANVAFTSGPIFTTSNISIVNSSINTNQGSLTWGNEQQGKTWFETRQLKTIDGQIGSIEIITADNNLWFPAVTTTVREWVVSSVSPANYNNSNENGYVENINIPFTYNSITKKYGFWVINKTVPYVTNSISISDLSTQINNIPNSGIAMISPLTNNSVALWNINQYVSTNDVVLHIEYQTIEGNSDLHSEFILLSNSGKKTWLSTPLYQKFIDSLTGETNNNRLVPNMFLPESQQYGILPNPQQSIFVDRATALKIYFESINASLANTAIVSKNVISLLSTVDPIPTVGFNTIVLNRDILNNLDISIYPIGYKILVNSDNTISNSGWSIVSKININTWKVSAHQMYDLSTMWKYADWKSPLFNSDIPPTYTVNNSSDLNGIILKVNDTVGILNNGDGEFAIYQITQNLSNKNVLEFTPIYIQNGTIQFLPNLYDFSNIGFDEVMFDLNYFDEEPTNEIRIITNVLNQNILIGSLSKIADDAFFAIIRFIIHENKNLDWLFSTSFISVDRPIRDLSTLTNYRVDDQELVENFLTEGTPFHTRIRQFNNIYQSTDYANISVTDFDFSNNSNGNISNFDFEIWENNHTYGILSIDVINPGNGYTITPEIVITSDSGSGANAIVIINPVLKTLDSVIVTKSGSGYIGNISALVVGGGANISATIYPRLSNNLTRKNNTKIKFDRISYNLSYYDPNSLYIPGDSIFDNLTNKFYTSIIENPSNNFSNTSQWKLSLDSSIENLSAIDRIHEFYHPNSNMLGNKPKLLMSGVSDSRIRVDDLKFDTSYSIPNNLLSNQSDPNAKNVALNVYFNPDLVENNILSNVIAKFGNTSGSFDPGVNRYIQVDWENTTEINQLNIGQEDFTLEFFFRFNTLDINNSTVLFDSRTYGNNSPVGNILEFSGNSLVVSKTINNQIDVSFYSGNNYINSLIGGSVSTNVWQYFVIQRSGQEFKLYLDGNQVSTLNFGANVSPTFDSWGLTFGADASGNSVINGYVDEFRLTSNILRYPFNNNTINVPIKSFSRSILTDPYLGIIYTKVLYGFEGFINEAAPKIVFKAINNQQVLSDVSWNVKDLLINGNVNISGNSIVPSAIITGNNSSPIFGNIYSSTIINSTFSISSILPGTQTLSNPQIISFSGSNAISFINAVNSANISNITADIINGNIQIINKNGTQVNLIDGTYTPLKNAGINSGYYGDIINNGLNFISKADFSGGYLSAVPDTSFNLDKNDFTIENWFNTLTGNGIQTIYEITNNESNVNILTNRFRLMSIIENGNLKIYGFDIKNESILDIKAYQIQSNFAPSSNDKLLSLYRTTFSNNFIDSEQLKGIDGINNKFYLNQIPSPLSSLQLYYNGQLLDPITDFSMTGNLVTLNTVPSKSDLLIAFYRINNSINYVDNVIPNGLYNSINKEFNIPSLPISEMSFQLYYNGILLTQNIDYIINGQLITLLSAPAPSITDKLRAYYSISNTDAIIQEIPNGLVNGENKIYTLSTEPSLNSLRLFYNGILLNQNYQISGEQLITNFIPGKLESFRIFLDGSLLSTNKYIIIGNQIYIPNMSENMHDIEFARISFELTAEISNNINYFMSLERKDENIYLFLNGDLIGSTYAPQNIPGNILSLNNIDNNVILSVNRNNYSSILNISANKNGLDNFYGSIADFRLTNGIARHVILDDMQSSIFGYYTDTGIRSQDLLINGGNYVDSQNAPSPEEHVPAKIFESLDIQVYQTDTITYSNPVLAYRLFKNTLTQGPFVSYTTRADGVNDIYAVPYKNANNDRIIVEINGNALTSGEFSISNNKLIFSSIPGYGNTITIIPTGQVDYYAIGASGITTLSANLLITDQTISLTSVEGLLTPNPSLNVRGVIFVNGERITYLYINRITNTISGISRGTLGTSIPNIHLVNSRVSSACSDMLLPSNNPGDFTWYTPGNATPSDGNGLANSDTIISQFLLSEGTVLP